MDGLTSPAVPGNPFSGAILGARSMRQHNLLNLMEIGIRDFPNLFAAQLLCNSFKKLI